MRARGLDPEFPPEALAEVARLGAAPRSTEEPTRDLRSLLWCSIDNDDSRDLDQLSVAEELPAGAVRMLVAIADVDAIAAKDSPVDRHAAVNTTSVYTPAIIFPMLHALDRAEPAISRFVDPAADQGRTGRPRRSVCSQ